MTKPEPFHHSTCGVTLRSIHCFRKPQLIKHYWVLLLSFTIWSAPTRIFGINCSIPKGVDKEKPPLFWCSLTARITLTHGCNTLVKETFDVPWTVSKMHRVLVKHSSTPITSISLARIENSREDPVTFATKVATSKLAVDITFSPGKSQAPARFLLQYKLVSGVKTFASCASDKYFVQPVGVQKGLVSKWTPGGLTAERFNNLQVEFAIPSDTHAKPIENVVRRPEKFVTIGSRKKEGNVSLFVQTSRTAAKDPAKLIYFLRFNHPSMAAVCTDPRICSQELRISDLRLQQQMTESLRLGLVLGFMVLTLLIAVGVLICWCSSRARKRKEEENPNVNLPTGFRHFAYDTGDDQTSVNWNFNTPRSMGSSQIWNQNQRAEEIFVRDISPMSRVQKDSKDQT